MIYRRYLAGFLAYVLTITWTVPARALRGTEVAEQQSAGLEDLEGRLLAAAQPGILAQPPLAGQRAQSVPTGPVSTGLEERPERLGFRAWAATFGAWSPTRKALRKYDKPTRRALRGQINRLVQEVIQAGYFSNARWILREGIPGVAAVSQTLEGFIAGLDFLLKVGRQPVLNWGLIRPGEGIGLISEAIFLRQLGIDYEVEVIPEESHLEDAWMEEPPGKYLVIDRSQEIKIIPLPDEPEPPTAGLEESQQVQAARERVQAERLAQALRQLQERLNQPGPASQVPSSEEPPKAGLEAIAHLEEMAQRILSGQMPSPDRIRSIASFLKGKATDPDPDVGIQAQWVRLRFQELFLARAAEAVQGSGGFWASTDTSGLLVLLFEHPETVSWAPLVAATGFPVAVLTQTLEEAEGLRKLFEISKIPESRYAIESLENPEFLFIPDPREKALGALARRFQVPAEVTLRPVPPAMDLDELKEFLRQYGVVLPVRELVPAREEIERYLGSRA